MKSAILVFSKKKPTKNTILENRSDLHGKTYCIWQTNEGIRVFSFHLLEKLELHYLWDGEVVPCEENWSKKAKKDV
jgi:hypothetical protein